MPIEKPPQVVVAPKLYQPPLTLPALPPRQQQQYATCSSIESDARQSPSPLAVATTTATTAAVTTLQQKMLLPQLKPADKKTRIMAEEVAVVESSTMVAASEEITRRRRGAFSRSHSRPTTPMPPPPPSGSSSRSSVHLNVFLLSNFPCVQASFEIQGELAAKGQRGAQDLSSKLRGWELDQIYCCPMVQCRQSVYPLCRDHGGSPPRYSVEWALVPQLKSRMNVHQLANIPPRQVPICFEYLKQAEHVGYLGAVARSSLPQHERETMSQFKLRLFAFVQALFDAHRQLALHDVCYSSSASVSESIGGGGGGGSSTLLNGASESNWEEVGGNSASSRRHHHPHHRRHDTPCGHQYLHQPVYSKNILVCAAPATLAVLAEVIAEYPQSPNAAGTHNDNKQSSTAANDAKSPFQCGNVYLCYANCASTATINEGAADGVGD